MKRKGEAHKTLSLVFHRDEVPPTMVVDDSREQTLGKFQRKLREADCHHRVTEPYSPWQQATEGCICKLKRGSSCKMLRTGLPKSLWDHSLELEALVRSCTSKDIYMTAGQVPETIMTGDTADISHIAEFASFSWVMFRDNVPAYPNNKMTLGQYLGPATDMGSALTSKILKANGQFVCRTTVQPLDDDELQSSMHQRERQDFNLSVFTHLGPAATADDFEAKDLTPDPTYFDDAHIIDPDYGDAEITPEKWATLISQQN